jgi:hypothetical protein
VFNVLTSASVVVFPSKRSFFVYHFSSLGGVFLSVLLGCLVSSTSFLKGLEAGIVESLQSAIQGPDRCGIINYSRLSNSTYSDQIFSGNFLLLSSQPSENTHLSGIFISLQKAFVFFLIIMGQLAIFYSECIVVSCLDNTASNC